MIEWFHKKSLFFKLLVGGIATILVIASSSLIIISYFFKSSDRSDMINSIANKIRAQMYQARIIEKNFVQRDLYKKEFYESGTSDYLKRHKFIVLSVKDEIQKLMGLISAEQRTYVEEMLPLVDEYEAIFIKLIGAYKERGFKNWGLQGEWRKAIHSVEKRVDNIQSPYPIESLLQLRRYEKDYLLREEGEYIQKHEMQLNNMRNQIMQLNDPESTNILSELKTYESAFKKYVALQEKIGRTDNEGLQGEFLRSIQSIEPFIERTVGDAEEARQIARQSFIEVSLLIYGLGICLGSIFFYLFVRSISKSLIQLRNAALRAGKGLLDTTINIKSKDEIGVVAKAFNKMMRDLKQATVSKDYVDTIIESMTDMLIVIKPDASINTINQATRDLLEYREDELMGKHINVVIGDDPHPDSFIEKIITEGSIKNIERVYIKKDGSKIPVLFSSSIMRNKDGQVQGMVCMALDNTDRKRAENLLKKSEKELRLLSAQILSAQENERKRVALELHDGIGQSLTAIKIWVENNLKKIKKGETVLGKKGLKSVVKMIQDVIEETRRIAMDLRPSTLDDLGITATISWFCRQFQFIYPGITIKKKVDLKDIQLPDVLTTSIFRIVQEALSNVAKHSEADLVHLRLLHRDDSIELVIEDNGKAFAPDGDFSLESPDRGYGLANMKERTELSGGVFQIRSKAGKGTTISALWPAAV